MFAINARNRPMKPFRMNTLVKSVVTDSDTLTKQEYDAIVAEKRHNFMQEHFSYDLQRVFQELREKASKMLNPLSHTVVFHIQDHFDSSKISQIISLYFQDLGYTVSFIPINGNNDVCFILS